MSVSSSSFAPQSNKRNRWMWLVRYTRTTWRTEDRPTWRHVLLALHTIIGKYFKYIFFLIGFALPDPLLTAQHLTIPFAIDTKIDKWEETALLFFCPRVCAMNFSFKAERSVPRLRGLSETTLNNLFKILDWKSWLVPSPASHPAWLE